MSKLYRARSLLYRRQILQVHIRWKALDEIYKIYMLLHRSDLNISKKNRQFFRIFGKNLQKFVISEFFSLIFAQILMKFVYEVGRKTSRKTSKILSEFRRYFRKC